MGDLPTVDQRLARWLVLLGGALGGLLAVVTPPFQVADEPAHFYRAFSLSEGRLVAEVRLDAAGAEIPCALPSLDADLGRRLAFHPQARTTTAEIVALLDLRLQAGTRCFVDFRNTAGYSPLPYVPQALGIGLARLVTDRVLLLLLAARLANLAVGLGLLRFALARLPVARPTAWLLALSPMAVHLLASASWDALNLAAGCLAVALLARLALAQEGTAQALDEVAVCLALLAVGSGRPVYAPLGLLLWAVPRAAFRSPREHRRFVAAAVLALGLGLGLSLGAAWRIPPPRQDGAAPDLRAHVHDLVASPLRAAELVADDLLRHTPRYAAEALGSHLGWLDTPLPRAWVWMSFAAVVLSLGLRQGEEACPSLRLRLLAASAAALVAVGTVLTMAVVWTPPGSAEVEGVQGRYFLPVAWLAAVALVAPGRRRAGRWVLCVLAVWGAASLVTAFVVILRRYYG